MNTIARRGVIAAASLLIGCAIGAATNISTATRLARGDDTQKQGQEYAASGECWSAAPAVAVSRPAKSPSSGG